MHFTYAVSTWASSRAPYFPIPHSFPDPGERRAEQCFNVVFPVFKLFSGNWIWCRCIGTFASMLIHYIEFWGTYDSVWICVDIERCIWWIFQRCNPEYIREGLEKPQINPSGLRSLSRTEIIFGVIWFLSCSSWLSGELLVAFDIQVAFKTSPEITIVVCTSQRTQRASIMRTNQWML
jgi:hypothetical protein